MSRDMTTRGVYDVTVFKMPDDKRIEVITDSEHGVFDSIVYLDEKNNALNQQRELPKVCIDRESEAVQESSFDEFDDPF